MAEAQVETTQCPYCKEEIRADALVCKHCARDSRQLLDNGGICAYCKEDINPEATRVARTSKRAQRAQRVAVAAILGPTCLMRPARAGSSSTGNWPEGSATTAVFGPAGRVARNANGCAAGYAKGHPSSKGPSS